MIDEYTIAIVASRTRIRSQREARPLSADCPGANCKTLSVRFLISSTPLVVRVMRWQSHEPGINEVLAHHLHRRVYDS